MNNTKRKPRLTVVSKRPLSRPVLARPDLGVLLVHGWFTMLVTLQSIQSHDKQELISTSLYIYS